VPKLLIKAQQTGVGRGAWKRGHVVGVFPDGHVFGRRESLPRFVIVTVPRSFVVTNPELIQEEWSGEELVHRRKWRIDVDSLSPTKRTELEVSGETTLNRSESDSVLGRETRD